MSFTFSQQGLKIPLWTTPTSVLKSRTGATQALTGVRESWFVCLEIIFVHYYLFLSVLVSERRGAGRAEWWDGDKLADRFQ